MKSFAKSILISSLLGALCAVPEGWAQDAGAADKNAAPPALDSLSYKDINANLKNLEKSAEEDGGALYDPVVIMTGRIRVRAALTIAVFLSMPRSRF